MKPYFHREMANLAKLYKRFTWELTRISGIERQGNNLLNALRQYLYPNLRRCPAPIPA